MRNVSELILLLADRDIKVFLENGKLVIDSPTPLMQDDIVNNIKANKEGLIQWLNLSQAKIYKPIPVVPVQQSYPLSSSQRRLWILSQFKEGSVAYNIPGVYMLEGDLDEGALHRSFQLLIERHEILRTTFKEDAHGEIRQFISAKKETAFYIEKEDLRGIKAITIKLKEKIEKSSAKPFLLDVGPLLRAELYQLEDKKWIFVYCMHHIISDGWSMEVLIRELLTLYNSDLAGEENPLPSLRIQYKEYACWQQDQLKGDSLNKHRSYWQDHFSGELPLLEFPADKIRPAIKTYNGGSVHKKINGKTSKEFNRLIQQDGATLFMGLLGAINALLYRYTGQDDIIIGSPIAGREHSDLSDQIGFYVNTLALRTRIKDGDSFKDVMRNVKVVTLNAYEHQVYPFDELVELLQLQRHINRHPLFDVLITLQNQALSGSGNEQLGNLHVSAYQEASHVISKFDFTFGFVETGSEILLNLEYNIDLYKEGNMQQLANHLEQLIEVIVKYPTISINKLNYLHESEERELLELFNATQADYAREKTVIDLFEEQVSKTPDEVAVVYEGRSMTYCELNEHANQLGNYLRKKYKIKPDDLVSIQLDRGEWMIISILAVLKSGGAYVPIDPDYPEDRIAYMLSDSNSKVLIDRQFLEEIKPTLSHYSKTNLKRKTQAGNLIYVLYTSGSTGRPKGCMLEHRGVINRIQWMWDHYGFTSGDVILQKTTFTFDVSVWELFMPLMYGAKMVLCQKEDVVSPERIVSLIKNEGVSCLHFVPSMLSVFISSAFDGEHIASDLKSLRLVITSGESLQVDTLRRWYKVVDTPIHNLYGPTEASVDVTHYTTRASDRIIPIGRPIWNTSMYILNNESQLVPIGVSGEICIGGDGLARGYLNNPELTNEKFVSNPFNAGERIYKTGDLGRWLADGNIEFIGRKDAQVKIRGYRIELGEIEHALLSYESITSCVVITKGNPSGEKELLAYIVSKESLNVSALRDHLSKQLPSYMLPSHYVQLDSLPLTSSGKVDRKSLPSPEGQELSSGVSYAAGRNEKEKVLISVFEEVLKKSPIGIHDDFFVLGGDSIKSIQVVSRLRQRGYSLTIQDVLSSPVVDALSLKLNAISRMIPQDLVEGAVSLSPIQHHFFAESNAEDVHHFNQSVLLYSKTRISETDLRACFDHLVLHHDALRMVYECNATGWQQFNKGKSQGYGFEVMRISDLRELNEICDAIQSGINLLTGPLFKACLFRCGDGDRLLLVCHHLVMDGVSWRILLEDLSSLYQQVHSGIALQLPLKTDSFKYWQELQLAYSRSKTLSAESAYWSTMSTSPKSALPMDYPQGSNLLEDVKSVSVELDRSTTTHLLTSCYKAYHTEINDILLTGLSLALGDVYDLSHVQISLEGHGREDIGSAVDVSRTIGWFTSVYPVVFDLSYRKDMLRQLIEVKEVLHRVPNKGIGYGILKYLSGEPLLSELYLSSPAIIFNYLGDFGSGVLDKEGDSLFSFSGDYRGAETSGKRKRNSILDVSAMVVEGTLRLSVSYSDKQYLEESIQELLRSYEKHLLKLIKTLSQEERKILTPVDLTYKYLSVDKVKEIASLIPLEDIYPLSPLQEGIYYHWLSDPSSSVYFEQMSYSLEGKLDVALLEKSYAQLLARHAILRTHFRENLDEKLLQVVVEEVAPDFYYRDVSAEKFFSLEDYKHADKARGFDLGEGSQMRLSVLYLGEKRYEFIWSHHHILMDGWCSSLLVNEFFKIYYSYVEAKELVLPKVHPYANYISWLSNKGNAESLVYWKDYLQGYDTISSLPKLGNEPLADYVLEKSSFMIQGDQRDGLHKLCSEQGLTENTFMQTVWGLLLSKYNNTRDVVFGAVVSGRQAPVEGIEEMIGLFINTIPVRIHSKEDQSIIDLLKEVQQSSIIGSDHHYTQLSEVQSVSELGRGLFDHLMVYENYAVQDMDKTEAGKSASDLLLLSKESYEQTNYDFTILVEPGEQIRITFNYNSHVYDAAVIKRLEEHFLCLVEIVVKNPRSTVQQLEFISEEEKHQLLQTFNDTTVHYAKEKTVIDLFEEQVSKIPDQVAVVYEGRSMTYCELNEHANQLGNYLWKQYKIKPDELVSIQLDRSEWMIISILAVLKSGGAYVPIDPDYPEDRIAYMVSDSNSKVLIDRQFLEEIKPTLSHYSKTNLKRKAQAGNLIYVLYTSGSTGRPKGCMLEHRGVINRIQWMWDHYGFTSADIILQKTTFTFDVSVWELFMPLMYGAKMVLCQKEDVVSPERIVSLIKNEGVSCLHFVPSMLSVFISSAFDGEHIASDLKSLRLVITSGESLQVDTLRRWYKVVDTPIHNLYGPTEASVDVTHYTTTATDTHVPIGRPIWNTSMYILNNESQLVPIGVAGEICIGGDGLARGYLNRPELTNEKFVSNPFQLGRRMYKTGDLGRWLPDGNIEFIGRKDDQVKIRGYRIELGEIEAALLSDDLITSSVVIVKESAGEKYLVAYVVSKTTLNTATLRDHLSRQLPSYMLPSHYVQLESLPLTSSGKVDRKSLPSTEGHELSSGLSYAAPRNETEEKLVKIWENILGKENIGIHDNFFELGGHSLKVIRLIAEIHSVFNVRFKLKELFNKETISDLSEEIARRKWIKESNDSKIDDLSSTENFTI